MRYTIEPMRLSDIAQVMEIEKASFPTAWPASAFRREIQQNRLARYVVALEQADGHVPVRPLESAGLTGPVVLGSVKSGAGSPAAGALAIVPPHDATISDL